MSWSPRLRSVNPIMMNPMQQNIDDRILAKNRPVARPKLIRLPASSITLRDRMRLPKVPCHEQKIKGSGIRDYNAIAISATNGNRGWNRFSKIFQSQLQTAEVGMEIQTDGKSHIQIIARLKRFSLEPFRHTPSHSFIVVAGFGPRQPLMKAQLDVFFLEDSWRQQQAHSMTGKHRLWIAMTKWLKTCQACQQLRRNGAQRNLGIDMNIWQKIVRLK
jgi:hypothetical protein